MWSVLGVIVCAIWVVVMGPPLRRRWKDHKDYPPIQDGEGIQRRLEALMSRKGY